MSKPTPKWYFVVYIVLLFNFIKESEGQCKTPKNEDGECQLISNCGALRKLLSQTPVPQEVYAYLQKSNCGFNGTDPLVCCPSSSNIELENKFTVTTSRPRTTEAALGPNAYLLPALDTCGIGSTPRILGGDKTEIDEFPWMALLEYKKPVGRGFYCGGVLINSRYVMTAAHCVKGKDLPKTWSLNAVRLGEYNTDTDVDCVGTPDNMECSEPPIDVLVTEQIVHELYEPSSTNQYHDIALLRLLREVPYSDFIKPICLPGAQKSNIGQHFVAGWGKTEQRSESPIKLKVMVPLVNRTVCNQIYKKASVSLWDGQICAGGEKGRDSCRGDSGGSLMTSRSVQVGEINWFAEGIVSFGPSPCGTQGWPGVYTNVAEYVPWIVSKLKP